MTHSNTSKFVLKVWATTLLGGSYLTFTILSTLTTFAANIKTPFDLVATSVMVTLFATLMTAPVALIYFSFTEAIVKFKLSGSVIKVLLILVGGILSFLFFLFVFRQGSSFLLIYSSTMIFFYCYFTVLIISILMFKLKEIPRFS